MIAVYFSSVISAIQLFNYLTLATHISSDNRCSTVYLKDVRQSLYEL